MLSFWDISSHAGCMLWLKTDVTTSVPATSVKKLHQNPILTHLKNFSIHSKYAKLDFDNLKTPEVPLNQRALHTTQGLRCLLL